MYCPNCGKKNSIFASKCSDCGTVLRENKNLNDKEKYAKSNKKSKVNETKYDDIKDKTYKTKDVPEVNKRGCIMLIARLFILVPLILGGSKYIRSTFFEHNEPEPEPTEDYQEHIKEEIVFDENNLQILTPMFFFNDSSYEKTKPDSFTVILKDESKKDEKSVKYAFDNDQETAWESSLEKNGLDESIEINFSEKQNIKTISIFPGIFSEVGDFSKSNSPKYITVNVDGKDVYKLELDRDDEYQIFEFEQPIKAPAKIKLTINSIYKADKNKPTSITEIQFEKQK